MNIFFKQTTQDNVPIFKEFHLGQANKHAITILNMKMCQKKNTNE